MTNRDDGTNNESDYWEIAERLLDGFYRANLEGHLLRLSPSAVAVLGYDHPDELIGKVSMAEMWANPQERDLLLQELREYGEVRSFETTLKRKDGGLARVELSVMPLLDANGEMIGTDGVVRDVSQRSRSEQQFRSLVRSSPGAIFRYVDGEESHFTFMSDAITDITGYPAAFFIEEKDPLQQITHPLDRAEVEAIAESGIVNGEKYELDLQIRTLEGEARWIQIRGAGSIDPLGNQPTVDGLIFDVTESHRVAEELAESERQVQSLIRNVPGAIYHFAEQEDDTWRLELMSPAIEALTGYPPEYFVGKENPFNEILHPEDRQRFNNEISGAIASEGNFSFEHRILHHDGSIRWLRVQGSLARDSAHGRRFIDGVQLDVTDLYNARQAVERSEATFRHLFESMTEGYWVTDADFKVRLCNPSAVKILGYPDEGSLIGVDTLRMIVDKEKRQRFLADLQAGQAEEDLEIDVRCYDDRIVTLNLSTHLVGRGDALQTESTFRDITRQKQIDAEIREARHAAVQANRAKSTFLANMSHELRTPLNAIIGYSEMMMEDAQHSSDDTLSEDLGKVHTAGTHLLSLINDVLDLSKIEAGRTELFAEDFSLEELINSVVPTTAPLMAKNHNELKVELQDGQAVLHQDLTKIRQSLLNLLSNAAKFTEQGTVTLSAHIESNGGTDSLVLSTTDTGIGVPAEKHDGLFDEFSQADVSTTRRFGGTGLGLAISRRFCRMIGGDITLQSTPGAGSTFTIRVPMKLAETAAGQSDQRSESPSAGTLPKNPARTVLVIDDDPEACEIIARHLTRSGLEAVIATSGSDGLALAAEIQPFAITLDVLMPDIDGWSVLASLKADENLKDIPVVMVSMLDDKSAGYTMGATSYLTKPVERKQLLEAISKHRMQGSNVLIIEDEADTRAMLQRTLVRNGFQVSEAEDGEKGLRAIEQEKPDLILLDLMMPVMDGFDFLMQLRSKPDTHDIPVVVVTAKDLTDAERDFLSGRIAQVLSKGAYTREHLLRQIRSAVGGTA